MLFVFYIVERMAYVRRSLSDCLSTSDSSSDLSSSSETDTPAPNPILSLYRRELTEKGTEISQLKQQLDRARLDNLCLERALAMRQLNSYELECDLKETEDRLFEEERLKRREQYFSSQRLKRFPVECNSYNWEPSRYDVQSYLRTRYPRQGQLH